MNLFNDYAVTIKTIRLVCVIGWVAVKFMIRKYPECCIADFCWSFHACDVQIVLLKHMLHKLALHCDTDFSQ